MRSYCNNTSAVRTHLQTDGRPRRMTEDGKLVNIPKNETGRWGEITSSDINTAFETYARQLIVVAVSITETALAEVFAALFSVRSLRMKGLEGDPNQPGLRMSITFDKLNAADDVSALRLAVLERAVGAAVQGKANVILKRIERLFGLAIELTLAAKYS